MSDNSDYLEDSDYRKYMTKDDLLLFKNYINFGK